MKQINARATLIFVNCYESFLPKNFLVKSYQTTSFLIFMAAHWGQHSILLQSDAYTSAFIFTFILTQTVNLESC